MARSYLAWLPFLVPAMAGAQQPAPKVRQSWLEKEFLDRIQLSGSRTLGYQSYSFVGDADTFNSLTNFGTGLQRFTDIGNISLRGNKVLGFLNFNAIFTDNRFSDPEQQQFLLSYQKDGWDLNYGTTMASLQSTNRFINFSRSLEGTVAGYKSGRFATRFIKSEARGAARTANIEGNNTAGPYFLQSGRIIGGTVNVLLDGQVVQQGRDYIINTDEGSITFIGRTISPSSSIVATYESYDIAGSRGNLQGTNTSYDFGGLGTMSYTAIEQTLGKGGNNNERIELFQGFGRPGDQYFLQFEPIPASIRVLVNGVQRQFSTFDDGISEFYIEPSLPIRIISRIAVPTTQDLQIRYTPVRLQTANSNRTVSGFNWTIPVGTPRSGSSITYSTSKGGPTGGTQGTAESFDLRLKEGKGDFQMSARQIDPNYQGIEQTGFLRNENALDTQLQYFTGGINTTVRTNNSAVSAVDGTTGKVSTTRVLNQAAIFTKLGSNPKDLTQLENGKQRASRNQTAYWNSSRTTGTSNNALTTLGYNETYNFGKLAYSFGVENQSGRGRVNSALTDLKINTNRAGVSYNAGKNWTIATSASRSNIKTKTDDSDGYDYVIRASLAPSKGWQGGIDYTISDSGTLASLGGFSNGTGIGFGSGGFSGNNGSGVISNGQTKVRRIGVNAGYQGEGRLSGTVGFFRTSNTGVTTNNADIDTISLSTQYRITDFTTLAVDLSRVLSQFSFAAVNNSSSNLVSAQLVGGFGKRWNYTFGYNNMISDGGAFAQNSFGANADINYRLAKLQSLFFNASVSRTTGFYPQNDSQSQFGYAYEIAPGLQLRGKYVFRNLENLDPTSVGGAFRSNGFAVELTISLIPRR